MILNNAEGGCPLLPNWDIHFLIYYITKRKKNSCKQLKFFLDIFGGEGKCGWVNSYLYK